MNWKDELKFSISQFCENNNKKRKLVRERDNDIESKRRGKRMKRQTKAKTKYEGRERSS